MFMLLEDQYGVGDIVDLGEASGTVEAVGLRITTLRDVNGTVWYVRNGEILRVGNKSQGYAVAVVDLPLAHNADIAEATEVAERTRHRARSTEPDMAEDVLEPPEVLGVERVGPGGRHAAADRAGPAPAGSSPCSGRSNAAIAEALRPDAGRPAARSGFPAARSTARPSTP